MNWNALSAVAELLGAMDQDVPATDDVSDLHFHVDDLARRLRLEPTAGGTRLVHSERLTGILVPFLRKSLDTQTFAGFEAMNAALKARAEAAGGKDS